MSKATLVSIVPFPIVEFKPGIYPGFFEIPASVREVPEVLVIQDSVYYVEIDENRTIQVKCPAEDVAKSIVEDYLISNLEFSLEKDAMPGLAWLPDALDLGKILAEKDFIKNLRGRQNRWFEALVSLADDDWERTRQHKFISDMQRYACKSLKLDRPWIINSNPNEGMVKCIACASIVAPEAIVCPNCRCVLNIEKYKQLQFAEK